MTTYFDCDSKYTYGVIFNRQLLHVIQVESLLTKVQLTVCATYKSNPHSPESSKSSEYRYTLII